MRAQIIKPVSSNQKVEHENTVFLAGSIEMGLAEDWQKLAEEALQDTAVTIFNPRRNDWDSNWEQRAHNPQFSHQVNWEMDRLKEAEKEIEKSRKSQLSGNISDYVKTAHDVKGIKVANFLAPGELGANDVRELVTNVRGLLGEGAALVIGAGISSGKVNVVVATNEQARKKNLNAGEILNEVLAKLDGKGGGKSDMAQGAGTKTEEAKSVIANVDSLIR